MDVTHELECAEATCRARLYVENSVDMDPQNERVTGDATIVQCEGCPKFYCAKHLNSEGFCDTCVEEMRKEDEQCSN